MPLFYAKALEIFFQYGASCDTQTLVQPMRQMLFLCSVERL